MPAMTIELSKEYRAQTNQPLFLPINNHPRRIK